MIDPDRSRLDRLRRFLGFPDKPNGVRIAMSDGEPTLVVKGGEVIGMRATNGEVIPIPRKERRLEDLFDNTDPDLDFMRRNLLAWPGLVRPRGNRRV